MEEHLTRSLGVRFATRPDGKAREILGVRPEVMELFSSRRRAITAKTAELVRAFESRFGRAPNSLELDRLQRQATFATRPVKSHEGETVEERLDRWLSCLSRHRNPRRRRPARRAHRRPQRRGRAARRPDDPARRVRGRARRARLRVHRARRPRDDRRHQPHRGHIDHRPAGAVRRDEPRPAGQHRARRHPRRAAPGPDRSHPRGCPPLPGRLARQAEHNVGLLRSRRRSGVPEIGPARWMRHPKPRISRRSYFSLSSVPSRYSAGAMPRSGATPTRLAQDGWRRTHPRRRPDYPQIRAGRVTPPPARRSLDLINVDLPLPPDPDLTPEQQLMVEIGWLDAPLAIGIATGMPQ